MRVRRWSFWVWVVKQIGHHKPRYPFGLDLSYTSFAYSSMSLLQPPPQRCGQVDSFDLCIFFNVSNTGARDGADVPQLYVTLSCCCGTASQTVALFHKGKTAPRFGHADGSMCAVSYI